MYANELRKMKKKGKTIRKKGKLHLSPYITPRLDCGASTQTPVGG